jgi:hypothetical protein
MSRPLEDDGVPTMVLGPASTEVARRRRAALAVVVALGITAGLGGYFVGRSGGGDVDAARAAGAIQGKRASTSASDRAGYRRGFSEGRRSGYEQTYRKAFKAAYEKAGGP